MTASDPMKVLETEFAEQLSGFVKRRNVAAPRTDCDSVLAELEVLLAAGACLDREPERFGLTRASANAWRQDQLRDGIKAFFSYLDDEGLVPGWDIDGSKVSNSHYRAAPIICDALRALDQDRLGGLRVEIERQRSSSAHICELLKPYGTHEAPGYRGLNLIISDAAGLHEAGCYFGVPEWIEVARRAKERAVARQDVEGFFPDYRGDEDAGPSSAYMNFTLYTIIPLLVAYPEDALAERCVRGVDWMMKSFDQSGIPIDIFDERERFKYVSSDSIGGPSPLFFYSPAGREWLSFMLAQGKKFQLGYMSTVLNFKSAMEQKSPALLRTFEKSPAWYSRRPRFCYVYQNRKSALSVAAPWLIAGHGYLTGKLDPHSMWHRELQQHHSLYHQDAGIIFGGGNSLAQPEFSTLLTPQSYLCDRVRIERCDETGQTVLCENGSTKVAIHTTVINDQEARLRCEVVAGGGDSFWQLTLAFFQTRRQLLYKDAVITDFSEKPVSGTFENAITVAGADGKKSFRVHIELSSPCEYRWPLYPVNVREPGSKPLPLYCAVLPLKFKLPAQGKCIDITVRYQA